MAEPSFDDLRSESIIVSFAYILLSWVLTYGSPPDISIILFIITFLVTSYRCFARYTKRLWWYDDSVALVSMHSFIVFLVGSYSIYFCLSN